MYVLDEAQNNELRIVEVDNTGYVSEIRQEENRGHGSDLRIDVELIMNVSQPKSAGEEENQQDELIIDVNH